MYAYFEGCDPLKSKVIERSDQMLPYFMMKVVASYPGLPGLFVAGIFSGALSSVSSFVNSLAAVTLEDFLKPHFPSLRNSPLKDSSLRKDSLGKDSLGKDSLGKDSLRNDDENCENSGKKEGGKNRKGNKRKGSKTEEEKTGEKLERIESNKETLIAKGLALFFGLLCLALTYVAEQMAGILQASLTIFGVVGGPLLGLFTLGMCTRSCSSKAAFISFLTSLLLGFWIGFGSLSSGLKPIPLDTSTLKCNISTTAIQLSPITSFSISSKISSLSISSPKITSFPSLLSPSNSNVEYLRKRSKRAGKEMRRKRATEEKLGRSKRDSVLESMMVNTITSATNNEYSKEGSNHNGSNGGRNESINGFGTRGSNGRNNGYINGGIHGNRKSHEQLHQPVNLVHHSPPSLTSNRDQEYLQFMTTEPASSFSSSLSPSSLLSSSLSPSRWRRIKSSHKKSKSTKKKERILSSDSDVQSTQAVRNHDYNFLDYSLYESYSQFDHDEHLGEGTTGMERREEEEEMEEGKEKEGKKEETNSEGGEVKEQQVVIMNESVLVAKDLSPEMTRNKEKMRERGEMSKVVSKEKEAYSQGSKMGEKRGRRSTGNDKDQNVESAPLTVSEGFKVTNDDDGHFQSDPTTDPNNGGKDVDGHFQSDPTTDPNNGGNDVDSNFNPLNLDPVLVVRFDSDNHHDSHSLSFDSKPQSKFDSLPFDSHSLPFDSHSLPFDSHSLPSDSNLQPQFEYLTNNGSNEGLIDPSSVFYLYKLSYMYLAGFTCLVEIILGLLLSYTIFPNRNEVRPELLTPLLNRGIFRHRANDYFIGPQDGVNGTLSGGISSLNKREEEKSKIDGKNSSQMKSKNVGEMEMTTMVTRT